MSHHQKLTTEKYVQQAQAHEAKLIRNEMVRRSDRSIILFSFAFVLFLCAMYGVFQMPNWMPAVSNWLEEIGMLSGQTFQLKWVRRVAIVSSRMQAAGFFS